MSLLNAFLTILDADGSHTHRSKGVTTAAMASLQNGCATADALSRKARTLRLTTIEGRFYLTYSLEEGWGRLEITRDQLHGILLDGMEEILKCT